MRSYIFRYQAPKSLCNAGSELALHRFAPMPCDHPWLFQSCSTLALSPSGIAPAWNRIKLSAVCRCVQRDRVINLLARCCLPLGLPSVVSGACAVVQISPSKCQCSKWQAIVWKQHYSYGARHYSPSLRKLKGEIWSLFDHCVNTTASAAILSVSMQTANDTAVVFVPNNKQKCMLGISSCKKKKKRNQILQEFVLSSQSNKAKKKSNSMQKAKAGGTIQHLSFVMVKWADSPFIPCSSFTISEGASAEGILCPFSNT